MFSLLWMTLKTWSYEKKVVIFKKMGVTNGTYEAI